MELAHKSGINREDIIAMEQDVEYRPAPLVLYKLRTIINDGLFDSEGDR